MPLHNPWNNSVPVVDPKDGTATREFLRWLQENTGLVSGLDDDIVDKVASSRQIITPALGGLSGGGNLSADRTIIIADQSDASLPGTYGSATKAVQLTINKKGIITKCVEITISGGSGGGSIYSPTAALPTLATWVNQGTSTYTANTDGSATLLGGIPIGSGDNVQGIFKALTIPYSYVIGFIPALMKQNWQQCGIALRDSVSGKIIVFGTYKDSGSTLWLVANYNSPTSKSANVLVPNADVAGPVYLKISNDGTTRKASFGYEPHAQPLMNYSFAAGTFLTENQIGVYQSNANGGANTFQLPITLISWQ